MLVVWTDNNAALLTADACIHLTPYSQSTTVLNRTINSLCSPILTIYSRNNDMTRMHVICPDSFAELMFERNIQGAYLRGLAPALLFRMRKIQ